MDENVNPIYKAQLLKDFADLTVWAVGDAGCPTKGTLDPEILVWCEANGFILVTNNRVSMLVHLSDKEKGLNEFCDFIISASSEQLMLCSPIVAVVEAKNENIIGGLGQCIAEMVGVKIFND